MPRLVLWDIDKTLVDMGGLSGEIYRAAFLRATGLELRQVPNMAGRTDHDLALATFRAHGLEAPVDRLPAFYDALTRATRQRAADFARYGRSLPGAAGKFGTGFPADRTVVIGDTPYDIAGAKANGVLAVAVATGTRTAADLRAAGPAADLACRPGRAATPSDRRLTAPTRLAGLGTHR